MKYISIIRLSVTFFAASCNSINQPHGQPVKKKDSISIQTKNYEHVFGDDRPFPQCHASTMAGMNNGNYLFAWFAGKHEKNDDVAIWMAVGSARQLVEAANGGKNK